MKGMNVVAVIQARMGSTRLPGKMMANLKDGPVISHIIRRVRQASAIDEVVLATSSLEQDDILAAEARRTDTDVYRGSESDVLQRLYEAARGANAEIVVRVCADNPLISPECLSGAVDAVLNEQADYAGYRIKEHTVPLGVSGEAFTMESFANVESNTSQQREREHATIYYREHPSEFSLTHIDSADVFDDHEQLNRPDLRLTLDTAADYELLRHVYENVSYDKRGIIDLRDAIAHIDAHDLDSMNNHIVQRGAKDHE